MYAWPWATASSRTSTPPWPSIRPPLHGSTHRSRAAEPLGLDQLRPGEDVQAGEGLLRRVLPRREHRPQVGVQANGPLDDARAAIVLGRQRDGAAGEQLSA